jgi:hypothetical protein
VLEGRLRDLLPKQADRIFPQPAFGRIIILLRDTPKAGAIVLRDRLKLRFEENSADAPGFELSGLDILGPATYPEDGQTAEELLTSILPATAKRERHDG